MTGVYLLLAAAGLTLCGLVILWVVAEIADTAAHMTREWFEDRKAKPYEHQKVAQLRAVINRPKDAA